MTRTPRERSSHAHFVDRTEAGARLAVALSAYASAQPLVLGIPRGGVPVAYQVARLLDTDLDVIVARRIAAPRQPELAIGAVAADGSTYINGKLRVLSALSEDAMKRLTEAERVQAEARERLFRAGLEPVKAKGRVVILVDDGLATGATIMAALRSLENAGAQHLVVAAPVGSVRACTSIAREVDAVVCLAQPEPFHSVGEHYQHFEPVSDDEVHKLLIKQRQRRASAQTSASSAIKPRA